MQSGFASEIDRRFMAAAIRYSRWHLGLTGTNPSVATLIVRDDGAGPRIVGRGVTALGGRPHAEREALEEAGEAARGAVAYVTLEPCAHHGRTPPCATALITAGITRVVGAASDPDPRVSGKGYAMLRQAGIEVVEGVLADQAADLMSGYLTRSTKMRPEVILKLAISADGMIGIKGQGQIWITGEVARRQVHLMRAEADAILVGINTALADDPLLTCRLPGLEVRSPTRIVLDRHMRLPPSSALVRSARQVPLLVTAAQDAHDERRALLTEAGVRFLAVESLDAHIALPELLEDIGARGFMTLLVEGGAITARQFLAEGLVDRLCLFIGSTEIGGQGIAAPIDPGQMSSGFSKLREERFGEDHYIEYVRSG
ncbi:bifunctional diaminohydroxyphosphoribosylaminopyrimidine deaminase/5-amino-6-(5-phosphoribosylamino)uracil reductase RibD [Chelativorans sp. Marseille-P2723]|uniref:bifunctional diaminohydroxyphosphoribosylaminopyrimidine deaminase/5-amino-6-(5-phosphoribosylamino)uracil reductase RibD n=1 Tax=Chelativorans sp. Marseille-P2723 TaxID=2709133 RepID=UPI00156D6E06|nr:bifunctional diaminohydroxyphosphoribosylaminopyrimidine deaminase/5-amino-6-(5-phosphoribosylamino)uracil reductase RibD [Chelativorans sp. Marseille-P2723]